MIEEIAESIEKFNLPDNEIQLSKLQTAEEIKEEKKEDVIKFVETELKIRTIQNEEEEKQKKNTFNPL